MLLALALLRSGNETDAVGAANRVLALDPERREALRVRAQANERALHYEDALRDFDRLIELDPGDIESRVLRVAPLLQLGRIGEAAEALRSLREDLRSLDLDADPALAARLCAAP